MEAMRCSVEYLSEFRDCQSYKTHIIQDGTNLLLTSGDSHVLVFHIQQKRVTNVLHFETPVTYVALSDDKLRLYALCESGGLYCIPLPTSSSAFSVNKSTDPVMTKISDDYIVLRNVSLQAVIIVEKILVTLSLHKSVWSFDVYEEPGSKPLHKLACFRVTTVNTHTQHDSLNTTEDLINTDKNRKFLPVLTCIYPAVSTSLRAHKSDLHHNLELRLFRLLFGVDASLVNSPVILCGLPDGRICCFPLLLPQTSGPKGEHRSPIKVLQSLEQPIVFIGTCDSGEGGPQCLVAVGQRGKLLLVRSKEADSENKDADYSFNEHSIRGPVLCACVDDKCLFYSSLNDLQALQLTKTSLPEEATESQLPALSSNSLGVCRVVALARPYTNATVEGSAHLLALSLSGKLMQVNLPQGHDKENQSTFSSSQAGQRVKDLLASIGNVWEKAESLKQKLQGKNESLKRLNQVMNVCNLLLNNRGHQREFNMDKQPISCRGVVRWSSLLQKDSLTLMCVLENASAFTLEQGWTLCLQAHPLSQSQECSSRTYSFPFRKLDCGQKLNVTIPIERVDELPVKVFCSLAFTLTALFGASDSSSQSLGVSQHTSIGSISVPLNTLTVDWLDALRLERSFPPGHNSTADTIQAFLRSKGVLTQDSDIAPKSGHCGVVVRVSSELLKSKLHLTSTSSAEMCSSVLNWLVSKPDTAELVSVQTQVVCAYSPHGQPVKLLAKEVTLGDFSSEGPLNVLEICVESSSLAAVCGLHHAILRRLQVLLGDRTTNHGHAKPLQAQRLCETVRHVESLYKDLQDAYNQAALGGTTESNKSSEILFRIFLDLRSNPLVII